MTQSEEDGLLRIDEYMAGVGVDMLHAGGMSSTEELVEMCEISEGKIVLDAGCGLGRTACHLARRHRCNVLGVDISERMIEGARGKAQRECVGHAVNFQVSNVESLGFDDRCFDAVISEGSTVSTDKKRALREYVRVAKIGGYVGLNELSWRKNPSEELTRRAFVDLQGVNPLTYDQWTKLLADSGLGGIRSRTYKYSSTSWDIIRSLGLYALIRVGVRYLTDSRLRRTVNRQESLFREYSDYWGYGLYVGRKQDSRRSGEGTSLSP